MVDWILSIDPWGFPVANPRVVSTISTGIRTEEIPEESEAEKQRRWHEERWDLQPEFESEIPYSDASEYPWLFDPNYRPPGREDEEHEREFQTWEETRPIGSIIYYNRRYEEDYDREAEFLEEASRAMAL